MSRTILVALFLGLLVICTAGCGESPKDQIPTQMQTPPKEPPTEGKTDFFHKPKK